MKVTPENRMPLVPGANMHNIDVKLYDAVITISEPTVLPPAGGHAEAFPVQVLKGLHVTLPALEVNVTLSEDAGMPSA